MRRMLKAGTAMVLSVSCVATNVWAATPCAKVEDISAVQATAVQQQLMVAGFSCRELAKSADNPIYANSHLDQHAQSLDNYNSFQTTYQKELQKSDGVLMKFFRRVLGAKGTAEYHAFKTRVANAAQLAYMHDAISFCNNAKTAFDAALGAAKSTLAAFVATQPVNETDGFESCDIKLAGGMVPNAPVEVPVPRLKPDLVSLAVPAPAPQAASVLGTN